MGSKDICLIRCIVWWRGKRHLYTGVGSGVSVRPKVGDSGYITVIDRFSSFSARISMIEQETHMLCVVAGASERCPVGSSSSQIRKMIRRKSVSAPGIIILIRFR
jgi:hypothetical protein